MNLKSGVIRLLCLPMCRGYARHRLGEEAPDPILRSLWRAYFWAIHGYWPHFGSPRSFSEKVWNRMLYDRDSRWTILSDKLLVRDYVREIVGSEYLIPLLWSGDNPERIPFGELPFKFVIKANHGCGYNVIVQDKAQLDQENVKLELGKWLRENYCQKHLAGMEWGYKNIKPTIIIESFLEENGSIPADYKFLCYSGRVEYIQVDCGRFTEDHTRTFFDREFKRLEFEYGKRLFPGEVLPPENFKDMVQLAESIAKGFNFLRVDLYSVGSKVYVGELTCYPGGGVIKFIPKDYDFLLGKKWKDR